MTCYRGVLIGVDYFVTVAVVVVLLFTVDGVKVGNRVVDTVGAFIIVNRLR